MHLNSFVFPLLVSGQNKLPHLGNRAYLALALDKVRG